jgi:hypothetical protein
LHTSLILPTMSSIDDGDESIWNWTFALKFFS